MVPEAATVVEGSTVMVCVQMAAASAAAATLGTEVVVSLTTADGTGSLVWQFREKFVTVTVNYLV